MKVYLVTTPNFDHIEFERFIYGQGIKKTAGEVLRSFPRSSVFTDVEIKNKDEALVEAGARLCYKSYGKGRTNADEFFNNILESEHFSVLEHAVYGFIIADASRSLTHELVRHRHLSFSELSQRFVTMEDENFRVVLPPLLDDDETGVKSTAMFDLAMERAQGRYEDLREALKEEFPDASRKQINEAARSVLPNATATSIMVTGNLRAWREFCVKRGSNHADAEIRLLAGKIFEILKERAPRMMADMGIDPLTDNIYMGSTV